MIKSNIVTNSFLMISLLTGCGGGPTSVTSPSKVTGVASVGAPMSSATVTVKSLVNGLSFNAGITDSEGKFSFEINTTQYPFPQLIRITSKSSEGAVAHFSYLDKPGDGFLVTPFSSAALALGANRVSDAAFRDGLDIGKSVFDEKAMIIYQAVEPILSSIGVTRSEELIQNVNFIANGKNADSFFDIVKINYDGTLSGDLLITSKFSGKAVELDNNTTKNSVGTLATSGTLSSNIIDAINENNLCLEKGLEANSKDVIDTCLASGFEDSGIKTAQELLERWKAIVAGELISEPSQIKWCNFNDDSLSFSSEPSLLQNQEGICLASHNIVKSGESNTFSGYYTFKIDSSGENVSSVELFGNQVATSVSAYPFLIKKVRIDGISDNTGIASGYRFDISTGIKSDSENSQAKVVAARVRLKGQSGNSITGGTFYMQCRQGGLTDCTDSYLSMCTSSNCAAFELFSDGVFTTSETFINRLIEQMKTGQVLAEIVTYSDTNRSSQVYTKDVGVVGIPIAQKIAEGLGFPSLNNSSVAILSSWVSDADLSLSFSTGMANLFEGVFKVMQGTEEKSSISRITSDRVVISSPNSYGVGALSGNCDVAGTLRSFTFRGSLNDTSTEVKYFGSCSSSDF